MKAFIPLGNRLLVRPSEPETKRGSLYLPSQAQIAPTVGEVISTGEGLRKEDGTTMPMSVKVGDKILYTPYSTGTQIEIDFIKYLLIEEKDVLGLVYE